MSRRLLPAALLVLAGGVAAQAGPPASPSPSPSPSSPARKPAPTYTEEDLKKAHESGGTQSLQATGMPPAPARQEAKEDQEGTEGPQLSERELTQKRWERRGADARGAITKAEAKVTEAQKVVDRLFNRDLDLSDANDPNRDLNRQARLAEAQAALEQAKAELAAARKAYEDLQEEARRASVPPGWVR